MAQFRELWVPVAIIHVPQVTNRCLKESIYTILTVWQQRSRCLTQRPQDTLLIGLNELREINTTTTLTSLPLLHWTALDNWLSWKYPFRYLTNMNLIVRPTTNLGEGNRISSGRLATIYCNCYNLAPVTNPWPLLCLLTADSETSDAADSYYDVLMCGSCQKTFALGEIVKFIQHKVLQCNKENYGQCYTQGGFYWFPFLGAFTSTSAPPPFRCQHWRQRRRRASAESDKFPPTLNISTDQREESEWITCAYAPTLQSWWAAGRRSL